MKHVEDSGGILYEDKQLGRFPMDRFRRVERPTTLITEDIQRIDYRENPLSRAARGDFGPAVQKEGLRLGMKYPLAAAQMKATLSLSSMKESEVATYRAPIPEDPVLLTRHIKRLGYFLKADIVGICQVPEYAFYSHDNQGNPIDASRYKFAVVLVMGKEFETVRASTGYDWIVDPISFRSYQHLALVTRTIADYIRQLGYPASAEHPFKAPQAWKVTMHPLILWTGIGELCRIGIILNPYLGASYKAAAVLTDLPLTPDKPIDFGLQDFCQRCKKCAVECPSRAIPMGDKALYNGYETWKLDSQRCVSFNLINPNGAFCGRCSKVCPWTRPTTWNHNFIRWAVKHSLLARRFFISVDNIFSRGQTKGNQRDKWWFDLEEVDGVLRTPMGDRHQDTLFRV